MTADLIDPRILAILPFAIAAISTLLIRAGAGDRTKQLVPTIVTAVLVVAVYAIDRWPDRSELIIGQIFALVVFSGKTYDIVNSVVKSTAGKSLNDLAGPGLIGAKTED